MDTATAISLLAAYALGSIPFAYLAVFLVRGTDIRTLGSGNVGATNAGRVLGRGAAVIIYILDAVKGAGAVFLGRWLAPSESLEASCGLLAVLGHVFPIWLKFKGGKGVATTTGVFLALSPAGFAIAGALWILAAMTTRMVSVASILLAISLPIALILLDHNHALGPGLPTTLLAFGVAVFVTIKHRSNISRVLAGTEPKIGQPKMEQKT